MPCFWSVRLHNIRRYQHLEKRKRLRKIKESIEACIYIYENEFFKLKYKYFEKTENEEYISYLKWEVQGLESEIEFITKRIIIFQDYCKATTLG